MGSFKTELKSSRFRILFTLCIGLLSISSGSILVKLSQEAPSLTIAFFRMLFASLILLPFYLMDASPKNKTDKIWLFIAGSSLALHFAFWISSLAYTSVAVSVLLVNTSPVLVALFSHFVFKEQLTLKGLLGVTLAFSGSILLFTNDLYTTTNWRGATLSLSGAVMFGIYLVAGRKIRHQANLIQYVYPTYALSTVVLGIFVLTSNLSVSGFSKNTYLFLFLLGLIPQCIGHTCYNWCLKHIPATVVSTLVMAEPVLASLLAYWIFGETVGKIIFLGGIVIGIGILIVSQATILSKPEIEVAAAILIVDDKIWIQKRENVDHLMGYWEFPGGKLQSNELPSQALVRELQEELGIAIEEHPKHFLLTQDYVYSERKVKIHFFIVPFNHQFSGKGRWVSPEQLAEYNFPPANKLVLEKIRHLS